jgi:hypothetical protein
VILIPGLYLLFLWRYDPDFGACFLQCPLWACKRRIAASKTIP